MERIGVELIHVNDKSMLTEKEFKDLRKLGKGPINFDLRKITKEQRQFFKDRDSGKLNVSVMPGVDIELRKIVSREHPVGAYTPPGSTSYTVVANSVIPKGTLLGEYTGEIVSDFSEKYDVSPEYSFGVDRLVEISHTAFDEKAKKNIRTKIVEKSRLPFSIDALRKGNIFRFMNDPRGYVMEYEEKPNVESETHWINGMPRILIFALNDLEPGDELLLSYGKKYWKDVDKKLLDAFVNWINSSGAIEAVERVSKLESLVRNQSMADMGLRANILSLELKVYEQSKKISNLEKELETYKSNSQKSADIISKQREQIDNLRETVTDSRGAEENTRLLSTLWRIVYKLVLEKIEQRINELTKDGTKRGAYSKQAGAELKSTREKKQKILDLLKNNSDTLWTNVFMVEELTPYLNMIFDDVKEKGKTMALKRQIDDALFTLSELQEKFENVK